MAPGRLVAQAGKRTRKQLRPHLHLPEVAPTPMIGDITFTMVNTILVLAAFLADLEVCQPVLPCALGHFHCEQCEIFSTLRVDRTNSAKISLLLFSWL